MWEFYARVSKRVRGLLISHCKLWPRWCRSIQSRPRKRRPCRLSFWQKMPGPLERALGDAPIAEPTAAHWREKLQSPEWVAVGDFGCAIPCACIPSRFPFSWKKVWRFCCVRLGDSPHARPPRMYLFLKNNCAEVQASPTAQRASSGVPVKKDVALADFFANSSRGAAVFYCVWISPRIVP